MEFAIIGGIATFINFAVIYWKFNTGRIANAVLDTAVFVAIIFIFSGTVSGAISGMIASALFSILLAIMPPKLPDFAI